MPSACLEAHKRQNGAICARKRYRGLLPTLPAGIWSATGPRRLLLVTCGGPIGHSRAGNAYRENILVYATPPRPGRPGYRTKGSGTALARAL
jgi:hypothetical protein